MLKTTITKIKKVCMIAFVPRILRGEIRYASGKFEKSAYGIQRSAQKHTKRSSSGKNIRKKAPEDPQKYVVCTICENGDKSEYLDAVTITRYQRKQSKAIPRNTSSNVVPDRINNERVTSRCDRCNELEDDIPCNVSVSGATPLYKPTSASHSDDCRRVIADIFGEPQTDLMHYERNIPNDLHSNITQFNTVSNSGNDKLITENRIQPGAAYNISDSETPKIEKEKEPEEDNSLMKDLRISPHIEKENKLNNLDTHWYTSMYDGVPEKNKSGLFTEQQGKASKQNEPNTDTDGYNVYKTVSGENSIPYEPNMDIDPETINVYRTLKAKNSNFEDTEAGKVNKFFTEKIENISANEYKDNSFINSTTCKQHEERLVQKLEHIEETPITEAEKSKLDSSNITPKVLGNIENAVNFADKALDEVAKRCLSSKHKQVDEILLREMEKLGIPITEQKTSISNEYMQSDVFNKSKESAQQYLNDLKRTQMADNNLSQNRSTTIDSVESFQNNKPLLSYDHKEPFKENIEQNNNANQNTAEQQLDPKHVLTCNETCPISPKSITDNVLDRIEGTQSIYERSFISKEPLLEHEGSCNAAKQNSTESPITNMAGSNATEKSKDENKLKDSIILAQSANNAINSSDQCSVADNTKDTFSKRGENVLHKPNEDDSYEIKDDFQGKEFTKEQLQATSEQLYETSEQLLATSDQLQTTSEQLQAATQILQNTSEKLESETAKHMEVISESLNESTEKLLSTGEKFETFIENIESNTEKLQNLCDNFKQIILSQSARSNDVKTTDFANSRVYNPSLISSVATNVFASKDPSSPDTSDQQLPSKTNTIEKDENDSNEDKEKIPSNASCSKLASLTQPGATLNPLSAVTNQYPTSSLGPLPEVNEQTRLSELMNIVRERNRLIENSQYLMSVQGKKNIPPLSMPMQNTPIKGPIPGYPELKPKPKICVPKPSKNPKSKVKCSHCDPETLGIEQNLGPTYHQETPLRLVEMENFFSEGVTITNDITPPPSNFTVDIILKLQRVGNALEAAYQRNKIETLEAVMLLRTRRRCQRTKLFKAKDFEPWTPIPSWPHSMHKKHSKPKLQCPKDGCKLLPPTLTDKDPPGALWPCDSFPTFPKRKFSQLEHFRVLLAKNKIIDLVSVENEQSPTMSRSFFKTEWTKPKYTDKSYTIARKNEEHLKVQTLKDKPLIPSKKHNDKNTNNNFVQKASISNKYPKHIPTQITNLNLERLLFAALASVSYTIVRNYTNSKNVGDDFWRPRSKIPSEEQLKNIKNNPKLAKQLGEDAKYLLLTFNSGGETPLVKEGVKNIQKTEPRVTKEVKMPDADTKAQKVNVGMRSS